MLEHIQADENIKGLIVEGLRLKVFISELPNGFSGWLIRKVLGWCILTTLSGKLLRDARRGR
ncbi:hypothetical protein D3C78_410200 [compost metagenome]